MNIIYTECNTHHNSIDMVTAEDIFCELTVGKQRKD